MTEERLVDEMWWDGPDFIVRYKDGQTWRYLNAVITDMKEEHPPAEGCTISDIDIKVKEFT